MLDPPLAARETIDEEVAVPLVVDDAPRARVVIGRIPDIIAVDVQVLVQEKADGAVRLPEVDDDDLAQVDVQVHVHEVATVKLQAQGRVLQRDPGNEVVVVIAQVFLPFRTHPGEFPVRPDSETGGVSQGVVLLPDHGKEDVADLIVKVEVEE